MAIRAGYETRQGVHLVSAYISICNVQLTKAKVSHDDRRSWQNVYTLKMHVEIFASEQAYIEGREPIDRLVVTGCANPELPILAEAYRILSHQKGANGSGVFVDLEPA